jgi:hypothetical protein
VKAPRFNSELSRCSAASIQQHKLRTGPQLVAHRLSRCRTSAAVRQKGSTETATAVRQKGSADQTSQPREPALGSGRAISTKKGSEDQDIESGLLSVCKWYGERADESARLGRHDSSPKQKCQHFQPQRCIHHIPIVTSRATILESVQRPSRAERSKNGLPSVTDGLASYPPINLDKDESGRFRNG